VNKESNNFQEEQEISDALLRYEQMLKMGAHLYFDVFQLEHIIENFLEEGKLYPALQAVDMGLNQHPTSLTLKVKKASILLNIGEISQALDLANELILIEKTNYELYLIKGSSHLLMDNPEEARLAFNAALNYTIEDKAETLFNIGFAYEQNEEYELAISYLKDSVELEPQNDEVLYELAYCYEKINEDHKSIDIYNQYLDIEPFSDSAWFNMGILYTKLKDYEKSIWAYEFALAINDDFPNAWFNIGHSNMLLENYKDAIKHFKKFLEYDNENEEIFCLIADCFYYLKKHTKAIKYFAKTLKINPLNANALYKTGLICMMNNDYKQAFDLLKRAIKVDDENAKYHYTYALVAEKLRKYKDAGESYETACELKPGKLKYWLSFAEMQFNRGQVVKAVATLYQAFEFHTENPLIDYRLAAYLLESNFERKASKHLVRALKNDYSNHPFLFESFPEAKNYESIISLIKKYSPIGS